jgi:hypothetical protein
MFYSCDLKLNLSWVVWESPKMNEIAQWTAIVVMFFGLAWLCVCIYSDR